jgi:hypothetical protein
VNTYRNSSESPELEWHGYAASWVRPLTAITFLALTLGSPVRSQEPRPPVSLGEAARNLREQKSASTNHAKIITNDDIVPQYLTSGPSASPSQSPAVREAEATKPGTTECDNPVAERLKTDLLVAQEEQDQIRRELSYHPRVISDGDVDMKNFKPGSSGLNVGSPPLSDSQPLVPARITEVNLDEKIASLKRAALIACDSPKDAGIQRKIDQAEQDLNLLQRQLGLDQATYYSKPNYSENSAGKARLDAELQQIQSLQSEVERLKGELAASKANPSVK